MRNVFLTAFRECQLNLKSRGFLMATFGAPLLTLFLMLAFGLQKGQQDQAQGQLRLGFLDKTGTLFHEGLLTTESRETLENVPTLKVLSHLTQPKREWMALKDDTSAREQIQSGNLDGVYIIHENDENQYLVTLRVAEKKLHLVSMMAVERRWLFSKWFKEGLKPKQFEIVQSYKTPNVEWMNAAGELQDTEFRRASISENEKSSWVHVAVFLVAVMLLSGYLITGLAEEREQRLLEYIVSVISPFELLLGKVIGIVLSGLIQVVTWGVTFVLPALFFFWSVRHALLDWLLPFCFFMSGYFFYASVLLSMASIASSGREARQLASSWPFLNALPFAFYPIIVTDPQGVLSRVFSLFPVTSPVTMIFRLGVRQVPAWEIALSFLLLIAFSLLALRLASRRLLSNILRKV